MKSRKAIALFGLSAVALATGLYFYLTRTGPEPVYEGQTVSNWLEALGGPNYQSGFVILHTTRSAQQQEHARTVLKKIGPKAIRFIVRKLDHNDSPWRNRYREIWPNLPAFFKKHFPRPTPIGFGVVNAANAFLAIGTNVIPSLLPKLQDHNPAVREAVLHAVLLFPKNPISTNQMVLICQNALADSDAAVRYYGARGLESIGLPASNTIPALIATLQTSEVGRFQRPYASHACAMGALAKMGPLAADAIPVLSNMMAQNVSHPETRISAAAALWQISSNQSLVFPALTNGAHYQNTLAIQTLGEMGPQAKEAFPDLVETLKKSTSDIRFVLTNALVKIDPIAAAKVIEENPQDYDP